MATSADAQFPCTLTIDAPFPTARLATVALRALSVDKELSPHVKRAFSTVAAATPGGSESAADVETVLRTVYHASTNRMLRVAVNSFMDSLSLVLEVMENLDVDVIEPKPASSS